MADKYYLYADEHFVQWSTNLEKMKLKSTIQAMELIGSMGIEPKPSYLLTIRLNDVTISSTTLSGKSRIYWKDHNPATESALGK
jgi:hypothetical protein